MHNFSEIIEGKVDSEQTYPPGSVLKDFEQFIRHEIHSPMYVVGQKKSAEWFLNVNDSSKKDSFEVKFFSFNSASTVEFL